MRVREPGASVHARKEREGSMRWTPNPASAAWRGRDIPAGKSHPSCMGREQACQVKEEAPALALWSGTMASCFPLTVANNPDEGTAEM